MKYFSNMKQNAQPNPDGSVGALFFVDQPHPIHGCTAAVVQYASENYPEQLGVHTDNEGFYVLCGNGSAIVGNEESSIREGMYFCAPAGQAHGIRKDPTCKNLTVFLYHFC